MSEQAWIEANSKLRDGLTLALEAEMSADEIQNIVDEEVEAFHSNDVPHVGGGLKPKLPGRGKGQADHVSTRKVPEHEADRGG